MAEPQKEIAGGVTAYVVESTVQRSEAYPVREDDELGRYASAGAILPLYDPRQLYFHFENSSAIKPCLDAITVNVYGHGYHLAPEVDLEASDADDKIRMSLLLEKILDKQQPIVEPEEVAARRLEIEIGAPIEKMQIELFLRHIGGERASWLVLLALRERDLMACGNAYWEALRDENRELMELVYVPATAIRLMPIDGKDITVEVSRKVSAISYRTVRQRRRCRRYVQLSWGRQLVFYKSWDDPRIMSADSGEYYPSEEAFKKAEPLAREATELLHFVPQGIAPPYSDYGVPEWVHVMMAIMGTRESEEANLHLLRNHATPSCYILVSGGKLAAGAAEKIKEWHSDNAGPAMRGRPCVIEAEAASGATAPLAGGAQGQRVRIEIKPVRDLAASDALYEGYEAANAKKVQQQFRLPDLLVGRSEETNRAQADAVLEFAEGQVFQPRRGHFDNDVMNERLLANKRTRYWRYCTNGPKITDPPSLVKMLYDLSMAGIITPLEARSFLEPALGRALPQNDAPFLRIPLPFRAEGESPPPSAEELAAQQALVDAGEGEDTKKPPPIALPLDAVKLITTLDEARLSLGLKALGGDKGSKLLSELESAGKGPPGAGSAPFADPHDGKGGGKPESPRGLEKGGLLEAIHGLQGIRAALAESEARVEAAALQEARKAQAALPVLKVPAAVMDSWLAPEE